MKDLGFIANGLLLLVVAMSATGSDWEWLHYLNGAGTWGYAHRIERTQNGHMYVAGLFSDTISIGDTTLVPQGENDKFVLKVTDQGDIEWIQVLVDTASRSSLDLVDLAADAEGNCYLATQFQHEVHVGDTALTCTTQNDNVLAGVTKDAKRDPTLPVVVLPDRALELIVTSKRRETCQASSTSAKTLWHELSCLPPKTS